MYWKRVSLASLVVSLSVAALGCARPAVTPDGAPQLQEGVRSAVVLTATSTAQSWPPAVIGNTFDDGYHMSFEELVWSSPLIAEVEIEDILPVRYNTASGEMPTVNATGPDYGLELWRPIVLRVTSVITGEIAVGDGVIVPEWGGATEQVTYLTKGRSPLSSGPLGPGVAMLGPNTYPGSGPQAQWRTLLLSLAQQRSAELQAPYIAAELYEYIEYDDESQGGAARILSGMSTGYSREALLEAISNVLDGSAPNTSPYP